MKQIITTCCLLFLLASTYGQNIIEKHFSTYKGQENFTNIHISSKAFELSAYLEIEDADEDLEDFKSFLATVKSFDMIAGKEIAQAPKKYQAALKKVLATHDELMTISEKGGTFTFLIDESNGIVKELVMVGNQKDHLAIFSLTGDMDLTQISKMSSMMKVNGAESPLQKMFDKGVHELKVYPNPIEKGKELTLELPEGMEDATIQVLNMNGMLVKSIEQHASKQKLDVSDLAAGSYLIEIKNDQVSLKKKILIR